MTEIQPITPEQAIKNKINHIPREVIEAFNKHITMNFDGKRATVVQKDVVATIKSLMKIDHIDFSWLNVEKIYEQNGWIVKYDKPGYNESYDAFFVFAAPKMR